MADAKRLIGEAFALYDQAKYDKINSVQSDIYRCRYQSTNGEHFIVLSPLNQIYEPPFIARIFLDYEKIRLGDIVVGTKNRKLWMRDVRARAGF